MAPSMSCLLVTAIGSPVVPGTLPIPCPQENQLQIRTTVAGINPLDQKARERGVFIKDRLPAVLGNDAVGVVTEVGSGVTKWKIGDRVFSQSLGALQEYAILDAATSARVPDGMRDEEVAGLPINVVAAAVGLFDTGEGGLGIPAPWSEEARGFDYAGAKLLVVGGGSSCGKFAVQLAKLARVGMIVVVAGGRSEEELRGYGASHVVDRHAEDVLGEVRRIVGDELVYAFDAVNGPEGQMLGVDALSNSKKGKLARLVPSGQGVFDKAKGKEAGFELKNVYGGSIAKRELCVPFWEKLPGFLTEGKIRPLAFDLIDGLDADKVNEVLDRYRDGKPVTKTHVRISG